VAKSDNRRRRTLQTPRSTRSLASALIPRKKTIRVLGKLLSVFALGMVGLWEGIPLGFVLGLPPFLTGLTSAMGSTVATLLAMLVGDRIRARLAAKRAKGPPRDRLIDRVWRRYGIVGFGLVAPCLIGAPAGVALGLFLRAPSGRLLFWLIVGIGLWAVILTGAGVYGSEGIRRLITG
jgi:hypothetical protein